MTNLIGQSLGRYHILEQLGEGGMATVYKAYDTRLERDVAIKVIRTDLFGRAVIERILKRFEREAKALAKLSHPNIVGVIDYGEHDGEPYLVLVYLLGGTLKERMKGKPIPWQEAVRLLIPIANALEYAHEQNVIHRDVKPANILLTKKGLPMLSDFGIAKIIELEEGQTLTGTGVGVGTPEYMAPEQGIGKGVDARADIYSLGIIFYELITGRKPYTADTPMAVIFKHMTDPLPNPSRFTPDLPEAVEGVLFKALAKDPKDRYADAGLFAAALENLIATLRPRMEQPKIAIEDTSETIDTLATIQQSLRKSGTCTTTDTNKLASTGMQDTLTTELLQTPKRNRSLLQWISFGVIAIGLVIALAFVFMGWLARGGGIAKILPTTISSFSTTPLVTQIPSATDMSLATNTPPATNTPLPTALPTLGIGSTMMGNDGMTLLYVPAGEFIMGSDSGTFSPAERPAHTISLDAYWIDQTEITNAMYTLCVQNGQCKHTDTADYSNPSYANHPVVYVNWNDANNYCSWVGRRLPSEAEWEKAARGTDGRNYPWGNNEPDANLLNFKMNIADTTTVGNYPNGASPYGVYDMAGNVFEWVNDWWGETYYQSSPYSNPLGPGSGKEHLMRGGGWNSNKVFIRSTVRLARLPSYIDVNIGFRCARSAE